jgi:tricorn protease
MTRFRALLLGLLLASPALADDAPLWLRYPAISPDGRTIAFAYKGDIYTVATTGGTAMPATLSESYEFSPVWSHDGRSLAFASDRYGNFDVFVMPSNGGEARRLTFHSNNELPSSFTADDQAVLFSACRQDLVTSAQFPTPAMSELYSVPTGGGRVSQVLPVPAQEAKVSSRGDKLIFHDVKGYENPWRQHHVSSVTRDVWVYDVPTRQYSQLTRFAGEDRSPVFGAGDDEFFYLSEESGSFNVFRSSLSNPTVTAPLTHFTRHPVRFLTRATDSTLCFGFDGEIYTMKPGDEPAKVAIRIAVDGRNTLDKIVPVNEGFTEIKLSPSGKEFAYVFRGEIFVSGVDGGLTKRITNTPWQERSVGFSPDGRSLVYAAEVDQSWNVYLVSIVRKDEPYFYVSTVLKTEPVVATSAEEYQPAFSPDGKEVAYLEDRVTLKVANLAAKTSRTIMPADRNYSYADGDQYYQWSPDGKWFLVQFGNPERMFSPEVGLVSADGHGEIHNLTLSGYDDVAPKWGLKGAMMIWGSNREGARQQSGDPVSGDVYGMFFAKAAFDRFKLSKEEFALVKDQEKKQRELERKGKGGAGRERGREYGTRDHGTGNEEEEDTTRAEVVIDWDNLTERKVKLTVHTSPASGWLLSKDGERLFYLTSFEKGNDLWVTELRTRETRLFAKLGVEASGMDMSKDGKLIVLLADGKPQKVDADSGKLEPLKTSGEMVVRQSDERDYIFEHAWRQFKEKFYLPEMNGLDWNYYHAAYRRFLPHINNNYDFAEMLSEMLGEVNVSHTGCSYRFTPPMADQTAALGLFYDYAFPGPGVRVAEVVAGGPLDKAASRVRAGHVIEKIDGRVISDSLDVYQFLNRKVGAPTLLSVYDPTSKTRWDETVKPISGGDEGELLYQRWVRNRRQEVEQLSAGRIGYVHVRAMNDASMRTVFEEALGRNLGKDAIIVDTRFNGGGGIHEQLSDFLSGRKYFDIIPHGQYVGSEPYDKWVKPSIVLMGEANYSDAHLFPMAYKLKGIGRTLGMPVPGTGTFVWWERQIDRTLVFGIPMGGWRAPDGRFCENNQMEPDLKVRNEADVLSAGRDQQIEAAVRELTGK